MTEKFRWFFIDYKSTSSAFITKEAMVGKLLKGYDPVQPAIFMSCRTSKNVQNFIFDWFFMHKTQEYAKKGREGFARFFYLSGDRFFESIFNTQDDYSYMFKWTAQDGPFIVPTSVDVDAQEELITKIGDYLIPKKTFSNDFKSIEGIVSL